MRTAVQVFPRPRILPRAARRCRSGLSVRSIRAKPTTAGEGARPWRLGHDAEFERELILDPLKCRGGEGAGQCLRRPRRAVNETAESWNYGRTAVHGDTSRPHRGVGVATVQAAFPARLVSVQRAAPALVDVTRPEAVSFNCSEEQCYSYDKRAAAQRTTLDTGTND